MGVVYLARHRELERDVAIKMILAAHLAKPGALEQFQKEARSAAGFRHPNIVGIFDAGSVGGQNYIVMEYVEGAGLDEVVRRGSLGFREIARMVEKVARAVHALHERGIVHRDLKPANIFVGQDGEPRVGDFGLAMDFDPGGRPRSVSQVGTPAYMAPEQIQEQLGAVGPRSDVYSLGAVLYECLTGEAPFQGTRLVQRLSQAPQFQPAPPRTLQSSVPRPLERICLKCMEADPARRYASAEALAADLRRFLVGDPLEAAPPGIFRSLQRTARTHIALAWRLAGFALFLGITLANWRLGAVDAPFVASIAALLAAWTLVCVGLDRFYRRKTTRNRARFLWATADCAFFTAVLFLADGIASPLVIIYALLIAGSSFWFRPWLVAYTTALVLGSYALLVYDARHWRPQLARPLDHHLVSLGTFLLLGWIVGYQVRRARALSRSMSLE